MTRWPVSPRNGYVDFFRGLALLIIFIAHIPNSWLWNLLPGRFGFSDSADIFVFCSGFVAASVYLKLFYAGQPMAATVKIVKRIFDIYCAYIVSVVVIIAVLILLERDFGAPNTFTKALSVSEFFSHQKDAFIGLVFLSYMPAYFEILPLYIVLLSFIPVFFLAGKVGRPAAVIVSLGVWSAAQAGLDLPGEPWGARQWFFNPFGYQLVFFTGAAFSLGWFSRPKTTAFWMSAAALFLFVSAIISFHKFYPLSPALQGAHALLAPLADKNSYGALRLIHLLVAAYFAAGVIERLRVPFNSQAVSLFCRLGSRPLGVFVIGLFLSEVVGGAISITGAGYIEVAILDFIGIVCLVVASEAFIWFKSAPWNDKARDAPSIEFAVDATTPKAAGQGGDCGDQAIFGSPTCPVFCGHHGDGRAS
jgi:hypothetical protein